MKVLTVQLYLTLAAGANSVYYKEELLSEPKLQPIRGSPWVAAPNYERNPDNYLSGI
jgi:hypothetical protein